jgi:transcriptional regulator with XRE-family HTH domain
MLNSVIKLSHIQIMSINNISNTDNNLVKDRQKAVRKALKLTQSQFAKQINVPLSTIGEIETGRREPSKKVLLGVLSEFEINLNWYVAGSGPMTLSEADRVPEVTSIQDGNLKDVYERWLQDKDKRLADKDKLIENLESQVTELKKEMDRVEKKQA